MRARLQTDAGSLRKDTEVDIVSKTAQADLPTADHTTREATGQPTYRVRNDEGHTEDVDTRDLTILR
jgi:hypothetical protein